MNGQGQFGFVYDIIHRNPNDEADRHIQIHNVIPDKAIKLFLGKIFTPEEAFLITHEDVWYDPAGITRIKKYSEYRNLYYYTFVSLMKARREAKRTDTIEDNWIDFNEITSEDVNITRRNYMNSPILDKKTNTIKYTGARDIFHFIKPTTITGVFLMTNNDSSPNPTIGENPTSPHHVLISEAMFPSPIRMELNGTISITCGCIVKSA